MSDLVSRALPFSVSLGLAAFLYAAVLGISLGTLATLAGLRAGTRIDSVAKGTRPCR